MIQEDMDAILKENNLDGEKLNKLDFYTRYGGKLVAVAIIGVLVWSGLSRKGKNEDQQVLIPEQYKEDCLNFSGSLFLYS